MYHPHSDEMVQMAMGMMGTLVVHPKDAAFRRVERDFAFIMSSYRFDPGTSLPKVAEMTDFNIFTFNARVFPGIDVLPVRLGDRVRIRIANRTMTNHPIHLHGHHFAVSCTDGGWVPETAQWPETTIDVPVGSIRAIEFVADAPGDWAFHCHKSHHTMNAMGHNVDNFIGVPEHGLASAIERAAPGAMAMGTRGMADMGMMAMPLPPNTLPMMTGTPSEALDDVWKEWDRFTGNAKDAEAAADELASSLDGAVGEEWKAAFQKITDACKSCHQDFREENSEREHQ